jgi:hypothetical protein
MWLINNRKERNSCETYGPSDDLVGMSLPPYSARASLVLGHLGDSDLYLRGRVQFVSVSLRSGNTLERIRNGRADASLRPRAIGHVGTSQFDELVGLSILEQWSESSFSVDLTLMHGTLAPLTRLLARAIPHQDPSFRYALSKLVTPHSCIA